MMKQLEKPAVQMLLLVFVMGAAALAFYLSKQPPNTAANQKPTTAPATNTLVAEETKVDLGQKRNATMGTDRQVEKFAPPPKKPAPPTLSISTPTTQQKPKAPPPYPKLAHISDAAPEPFVAEQPRLFAPRGTLIKAALVITVDSSSLDTPVIGLVTEDVYWNQKLILPAGTQVHAKASNGRARDRIEVKGQFNFIWDDGREYAINGVALDHERLSDGTYGITDGSTGIRGQIIKNDQYAELKIMVAEALSGIMNNQQSQFQSIAGLVPTNNSSNAALGGSSKAASAYSQLLTKKLDQDLDYVRVAAGTTFYIYTLDVFEPELASVAGLRQNGKASSSWQLSEEAFAKAQVAAAANGSKNESTEAATQAAEEQRRNAARAARVSTLLQSGDPDIDTDPAPTSPPSSSTP